MIFEVKDKFKLSENFLNKYKGKQPEWGPLGYIIYKRTYARYIDDSLTKMEEWWQTVQRVVEGTYTIQLNHCKKLRLPWNAHKAQKSAQRMYELIWDFKFLPPGRGLWAMGADVVYKKGSACLNNCGFISTKNIGDYFTEPFEFAMDMSMMGVGVSHDTKGANQVLIKKPESSSDVHVIADTREGWVEVIRIVLSSYIGKEKLPVFDFSQIRPKGSPIRTMGGVAPGPEPLQICISELREVLDSYIDKKLDSVGIVDVFNIIGKSVVAGGLRRVAQLMLGDPEDESYTSMKDYTKNADKLNRWRWASNNSVFAKVGMNYDKLGKQTSVNGEPGYFWLDNVRKYGRLIDYKSGDPYADPLVEGTNPCQHSETPLLTPNGICKLGDLNIGDTIWSETGWTKIINKWSTGFKKVYKYNTNAGVFYSTENHRIVENGKKIKVKNAKSIDILRGMEHDFTIDDLNPNDIMAGLLIGDGNRMSKGFYTVLNIGKNDKDYFNSEISHLITNRSYNKIAYIIENTDISPSELHPKPEIEIPERYVFADYKKVSGFLRGLYSANGNVLLSKNNYRIVLSASSKKLIDTVQYMLSSLGIKSYVTTNKGKIQEFPNGTYFCKESYKINICSDIHKFKKYIGFIQNYKNLLLNEILEKQYESKYSNRNEKLTFEIKSVKYYDTLEVFDITVDNEPHTYWSYGFNTSNCSEQSLEDAEICCLCETFPSRHNSFEEFRETLKYAYLYAKTVTLVPTHNEKTNQVVMKNRRIGTSQTGIVENFEKIGKREHFRWCDEGYKRIKELDKKYSDWLCIPRSIKLTSIKPSGSVSLLPGVTPGIHYSHANCYFRTVRIPKDSNLYQPLKDAGYRIEFSKEENAWIVYFAVKEKSTRTKKDVSVWEQVENVACMQYYWSDNQVSATITFNKNEAKDIPKILETYEHRLKSISFLPLMEEDHGYKHAPYQSIDEDTYYNYISKLKPLDLSNIHSVNEEMEKFCDGEKCTL